LHKFRKSETIQVRNLKHGNIKKLMVTRCKLWIAIASHYCILLGSATAVKWFNQTLCTRASEGSFQEGWYWIFPGGQTGAEPDIFIWGVTGGPVLQQGELSTVCAGLSERDLLQWHDVTRKILGGHWGGQAKFWGAVAPLAPPSSTPGGKGFFPGGPTVVKFHLTNSED